MRVVVVQKDKTVKVEDHPAPKPQDNEILFVTLTCLLLSSPADSWLVSDDSLKVLCAGQNPADYMGVEGIAKPGDWVGCDFVGEVVELGSAVPKDQVKKGEVRWGFIRGAVGKKGAFSEQVIIGYIR